MALHANSLVATTAMMTSPWVNYSLTTVSMALLANILVATTGMMTSPCLNYN